MKKSKALTGSLGLLLLIVGGVASFTASSSPLYANDRLETQILTTDALALAGCENDVCINGTSCEDGGQNLQCNKIGSSCNSNFCAAT
jgi:hypothetical protein